MRRLLLALAGTILLTGALAAPSLSAGRSVKIGDNFFVKNGGATVTVKKGQSVTWRWTGRNPHNVTVASGPMRFASKTQTSGSFSHKFTKSGTYSILCTIHAPGMKMKVVVR
ncbi:MAG: amidase [Actinobacteria bacterium]|nr:amidase [Actinomycetota bacterium]